MKGPEHFSHALERICEIDVRYHPDAYVFVLEGLRVTVQKLNRHGHVSGKELVAGLQEYAKAQFGRLAYTVLTHWGIHSAEDYGNIVFNLINQGLLGKSEQDSIDDFKISTPLKKAFEDCFDEHIE